MPFDRLTPYDLKIPEFHPYIAPPRPIFPIGDTVEKAVAQIADAFDPIKRAQRKLAPAELSVQLQQLEMQKQWMAAHPGQIWNPKMMDPMYRQSLSNAQLLGQWRTLGIAQRQAAVNAPKTNPVATLHSAYDLDNHDLSKVPVTQTVSVPPLLARPTEPDAPVVATPAEDQDQQ